MSKCIKTHFSNQFVHIFQVFTIGGFCIFCAHYCLNSLGDGARFHWYSTNAATDSVVDILHGEYFEGPVREGRLGVQVLFEIS